MTTVTASTSRLDHRFRTVLLTAAASISLGYTHRDLDRLLVEGYTTDDHPVIAANAEFDRIADLRSLPLEPRVVRHVERTLAESPALQSAAERYLAEVAGPRVGLRVSLAAALEEMQRLAGRA